jgi:hypothetical protein
MSYQTVIAGIANTLSCYLFYCITQFTVILAQARIQLIFKTIFNSSVDSSWSLPRRRYGAGMTTLFKQTMTNVTP